jgi:hypothetical protein
MACGHVVHKAGQQWFGGVLLVLFVARWWSSIWLLRVSIMANVLVLIAMIAGIKVCFGWVASG